MKYLNKNKPISSNRKSKIRVCLRVTDFECSPHDITRILGISPCNIWLKGDLIDKTGRANIKHMQNGWEICSKLENNIHNYAHEVQPYVSDVLNELKPYRHNFKNLPPESYIELSCQISNYSEQSPEINLDAATINEISYLNACIDIDYYHVDGNGVAM